MAAAPAAPTDPLSAELDKGIKKIGEHNYEVQRSTLDSLLGNMGALAKGARIVPETKDGKSAGFRLFSIRPDGPFAKIGLLNGDVVSAINGLEMNSPDQALLALHEAEDGESPLRRHRTQRSEDHEGLQHPMNRRTTERVATVVAILLGASPLRAAVVTGPDGKPVRVNPGESAPGASKPPASPGATPPPGTPRTPGFPGLPGMLGGKRGRPPAPTTTPGAAPATGTPGVAPAAGAGAVTGSTQLIGEKDFNTCKKFPAGKRIVKLNLKPDTELGDLIAWISSITCKQFLLPGTIPANSKKVTVVAPELITPEEAYRLFLGALESSGLTVEHSGKFERIVETAKIKTMGGVPFIGEGTDITSNETYQTRLVHVENVDPNEVATVLGRIKSEQGDIVVFAAQNALIITDLGSSINRMMRVLREIDQPGANEKVWIISLKHTGATEMAQKLGEIFQVQQAVKKGGAGRRRPGGREAEDR